MDVNKGVAYCGLVCAACSENKDCPGCRKEGCKDREWCKNFKCCKAKGIKGCWECEEFPCKGSMLDKKRIHAFAAFISKYGEEKLLECIERNERKGVIYHYPNQLTGDYDDLDTQADIIDLILNGRDNK